MAPGTQGGAPHVTDRKAGEKSRRGPQKGARASGGGRLRAGPAWLRGTATRGVQHNPL